MREGRERVLDRLGVNQAGIDRQRPVGVLSIEPQRDRAISMQDMKFAAESVPPWIIHAKGIDAIERKVELRLLELVVQHAPLLRQLLLVADVLELASAAAELEERAGWLHARLRRLDDGYCLRAPEVLAAMGDFGLHGLARDRALNEHDAAVDARDRRPAMGKLANRQPHDDVFSRDPTPLACRAVSR